MHLGSWRGGGREWKAVSPCPHQLLPRGARESVTWAVRVELQGPASSTPFPARPSGRGPTCGVPGTEAAARGWDFRATQGLKRSQAFIKVLSSLSRCARPAEGREQPWREDMGSQCPERSVYSEPHAGLHAPSDHPTSEPSGHADSSPACFATFIHRAAAQIRAPRHPDFAVLGACFSSSSPRS